jgi:hypothetical protein
MSGFRKTMIGAGAVAALLTVVAFAGGAATPLGERLKSMVLAAGEVNTDVCSKHPDLPQGR